MCAEAHTCNPSAWEVDEGWSEIQRVSREVTATHKSREANRSFFYLFSLLLCDCEKKIPDRNTFTEEEIILVWSFRAITTVVTGPTLLDRASWL